MDCHLIDLADEMTAIGIGVDITAADNPFPKY
jgi:hypothetical protein